MSGNWGDYPEARSAAVEAGNGYAKLGDETMHAEATTLMQQLDLQRADWCCFLEPWPCWRRSGSSSVASPGRSEVEWS